MCREDFFSFACQQLRRQIKSGGYQLHSGNMWQPRVLGIRPVLVVILYLVVATCDQAITRVGG